jgi:hypothetical protein
MSPPFSFASDQALIRLIELNEIAAGIGKDGDADRAGAGGFASEGYAGTF